MALENDFLQRPSLTKFGYTSMAVYQFSFRTFVSQSCKISSAFFKNQI
ncbi:Putative protein [Zobellia galactanivorans]|uniref:Uncharacterized protein n=1 Tax=Zobellia galactanivorans (strain DSM 12802 / CCUG 47099 / CIP 106680 / NCIMB 13871 / Dsij) TaxID=63186 RepID=G0LB43_ZOBGA|nr:Putative protein [Zobellia galactanivorans]